MENSSLLCGNLLPHARDHWGNSANIPRLSKLLPLCALALGEPRESELHKSFLSASYVIYFGGTRLPTHAVIHPNLHALGESQRHLELLVKALIYNNLDSFREGASHGLTLAGSAGCGGGTSKTTTS